MAMLKWKEIVGKTIKSVDEKSACNTVKLTFTDGTTLMVDTDAVGHGIYRPVLYPSSEYEPKTVTTGDREQVLNPLPNEGCRLPPFGARSRKSNDRKKQAH